MNKVRTAFENIDDYIASYPTHVQDKLIELKSLIKALVPEAKEKISYAMPTFTLNGKNLIHFAAFKNHIGIYPGAEVVEFFLNRLKDYHTSKGAIQFPMDNQLPVELIKSITAFCVQKNILNAKKN